MSSDRNRQWAEFLQFVLGWVSGFTLAFAIWYKLRRNELAWRIAFDEEV